MVVLHIQGWSTLKDYTFRKGKRATEAKNDDILLAAILRQPSEALAGRRGEHVVIPFDLLKAGLHTQRWSNLKDFTFLRKGGKEGHIIRRSDSKC